MFFKSEQAANALKIKLIAPESVEIQIPYFCLLSLTNDSHFLSLPENIQSTVNILF